ncbi:MAG: hypothetical protein KA267_05110 [Gemmatimonadales bacterium]|nr:hypothetical protein [Gemmatimonadales bacterium]MBP6570956.1 hypothetical protein [Gemmatimonadales bacterium]MBP7620070.1 hypothetical protein [Gemmatimonadales bacterium]
MRLALLVAAAAVVSPISLAAQAPKSLTITRDLLVPPSDADLAGSGVVAVSPKGQILVAQMDDNLIKVFAPGGATTTIGQKGSGPGEFQRVTRVGFMGDTLWALDPVLMRVNIYGPDFKYVRTFPQPMSATSGAASRPVSYFIQAVLPGGDLRAIASLRATTPRPSWATDVDSGATLLVRISPVGEYKRRLMVAARSKCQVSYTFEKGSGTTMIPFCPERVSTDWNGSIGVASVEVEAGAGKAGSYRVTVVDDQGATRFARSFPYTPLTISKPAMDSMLARRKESQKGMPAPMVAAMPKVTPYPTYPPIRRVVLGRDYSVWLEERILGPGHRWIVLDPKGATVGALMLPPEVELQVAELGTIWGLTKDEDDVQGVVRYRVGR